MFESKTSRSSARLLWALTAAVMAATPICSLADESASDSVKVQYSGATTPAGARHLYAMIERAAYKACGESSSDTEVIVGAPGPCVRLAIGHAVGHAKNPSLAQVYIEKNGFARAQEFGITGTMLTAQR